jgi:hypothetical protein
MIASPPRDAAQQSADASALDPRTPLVTLALAFSLGIPIALLGIAVSRSGFVDSHRLQRDVAIFALAAVWLPILALCRPAANDIRNRRVAVALTTGMLLPVAGLLIGGYAVHLAAAALLVSLARARAQIIGILFSRIGMAAVAGGLVLGVGVFLAGSGARYQLPEALDLGLAHADGYFHVAIAQMIARFGVPSIGADGLELQKYHFGSHLVAAGLARASGAPAALVYVYWGTVSLKLQLLWSTMFCTALLTKSSEARFPTLPHLAYVLVYFYVGRAFLDSESFMLALAMFVAGIPVAAGMIATVNTKATASPLSWVVLVLLMFVCATAKVSVGFFCGIILAWLGWRSRPSWIGLSALALSFGVLLIFALNYLIPREVSLLASGFSSVCASYLQYLTISTLVTFLVPVVIISSQLMGLHLESLATTGKEAWVANLKLSLRPIAGPRQAYDRLVDADGFVQLLSVCLVACVGVLFTVPIGSNIAYFSGVVLFMCACVVPAWFVLAGAWLQRWCRSHKLLSVPVGLTFAIALSAGFLMDFAASSVALMRVQAAQLAEANGVQPIGSNTQLLVGQFSKSVRESGTLFGDSRASLLKTPWAAAMRDVSKHRSLAPDLAVYVRPSSADFWQRLKGGSPYWCISAHLMIPATLGVPMIRGITPQPYEAECMPDGQVWYGFGRRQAEHRTIDMDDTQLCQQARRRGIGTVYILDTVRDPQANRVLTCQGGYSVGRLH